MIINGQFKTFGFWFSTTSFLGGLCFLFYSFVIGLDNIPIIGQLFFYTVLGVLLATFGKFLYDANQIKIDIQNKTIDFVNVFTRQHLVYNFDEFDGKLVWYEPIKGGHIRNFYFIKDKKAIKKISSFIYSNQKELEEALSNIKDLGNTKYSYLKSWKVFFGFPIID